MGDKGETYTMSMEVECGKQATWRCTRKSRDGSRQKFSITYDRGLLWWGLGRAYFADPLDVEEGANGHVFWYNGADEGQKRKPRFTWKRPPSWTAAEPSKSSSKKGGGKGKKKGEYRAEEETWREGNAWHDERWHDGRSGMEAWKREKHWQEDAQWSRALWDGWEGGGSAWRPHLAPAPLASRSERCSHSD